MKLHAALLLCLLGSMAACDGAPKYESGQRYDKGVRTVAVPVAKNATFDRKVAPELTDALVKAIESGTHFRVASEGRADTVLRATIRTIDLQQISKSRGTSLTEEMALNVTVDYEWIDLARFQVVEQLATAIVDSMQADW